VVPEYKLIARFVMMKMM